MVRLDVSFGVAQLTPASLGWIRFYAYQTPATGTPRRTLTGQYQPRPEDKVRRTVRLDVPFRVAISQPQLNTDGPLTDTAQWSNTGVTGTPNRTLTGRHQSRPKGETRRVVRLGVPFRVAISQPQLNTDGPLTDTAQWSNTGVTGTPNRTLTGRHQSRP